MDADKGFRDRCRWLRRLATVILCVLSAALVIEITMQFSSGKAVEQLAHLIPFRLPMLFYLAAVWTIRRTFARLADGEMFNEVLPLLLRRLGLALAGGGFASVFLTHWLRRAFFDQQSGSLASFDPPAITIGLVGLLLIVLGDLMGRATKMRRELDGFF